MDSPETDQVIETLVVDVEDLRGRTVADAPERYRRVIELDLPNPPGPGGAF